MTLAQKKMASMIMETTEDDVEELVMPGQPSSCRRWKKSIGQRRDDQGSSRLRASWSCQPNQALWIYCSDDAVSRVWRSGGDR